MVVPTYYFLFPILKRLKVGTLNRTCKLKLFKKDINFYETFYKEFFDTDMRMCFHFSL